MEPEFNLGFEIEFVSKRKREQIENSLSDELGIVFDYPTPQIQFPWFLHNDVSISKGLRNGHGHEISSEILDYKDGLEKMGRIFDNMIRHEDRTNRSTGLHINMSFKNGSLTKRIDVAKLVLDINEYKMLSRYGRRFNRYCRRHLPRLRKYIHMVKTQFPNISIDRKIQKYFGRLSYDSKFRSVNLGKLDTFGYIEFRMMGGRNYHKKFSKICKDIELLRKSMLFSVGMGESNYYDKSIQLLSSNSPFQELLLFYENLLS